MQSICDHCSREVEYMGDVLSQVLNANTCDVCGGTFCDDCLNTHGCEHHEDIESD